MDKNYYQIWRSKTIDYLGGKCVICGSKEDLEFDHIIETDKLFALSKHWSMKDKLTLQKEIDKCQLLCAQHHLEKTKPYLIELGFQQGLTHGSMYAWMKKRCTCTICCLAKKEWNSKRNAARRIGPERDEYGLPAEHGTYKRYKRGCKCDLCRKANNQYVIAKRQA